MSEHHYTFTCGHCGTHQSSKFVYIGLNPKNTSRGSLVFQCSACFKLSTLVFGSRTNGRSTNFESKWQASNLKLLDRRGFELMSQLPKLDLEIPDGLPEKVDLAYERAEKSYKGGNWDGATIQFRRSIELACKSLGYTSGNLKKKIDDAHNSGKIAESLKDWAHEIRGFGNETAHDDPLPEAEAEALAKDTREFAELFMTYVFTMPDRIATRQGQASAASP